MYPHREDKLSPYVYIQGLCPILPQWRPCASWVKSALHSLLSISALLSSIIFPSSHFFLACSFYFLHFEPLILPLILTSLSLSLIQAPPPLFPLYLTCSSSVRPSIRHSAVPRQAGGSRAGAGLTVQEVLAG